MKKVGQNFTNQAIPCSQALLKEKTKQNKTYIPFIYVEQIFLTLSSYIMFS